MSAKENTEVHKKQANKVQNRLEKQIIRQPVYDLLFNPEYRFMFEYHARIWYNFKNDSNMESLPKIEEKNEEDDAKEGGTNEEEDQNQLIQSKTAN